MKQENVTRAATTEPMSTARSGGSTAGGIKYEEKIVIRQGQPHVVRVPVSVPKAAASQSKVGKPKV